MSGEDSGQSRHTPGFLERRSSKASRPSARLLDLEDAQFRLSVNCFGAPALTAKEFSAYKQDLIVGASLAFSVPVGQYDQTRVVNLGTNRWFVKPELGVSKACGPLTLEFMPAVTVYSANTNFFNGHDVLKTQFTRSKDMRLLDSAWIRYLGSSGRRDLPCRRQHGDQRRGGRRPAAELARGRNIVFPSRRPLLRPTLCKSWRIRANA